MNLHITWNIFDIDFWKIKYIVIYIRTPMFSLIGYFWILPYTCILKSSLDQYFFNIQDQSLSLSKYINYSDKNDHTIVGKSHCHKCEIKRFSYCPDVDLQREKDVFLLFVKIMLLIENDFFLHFDKINSIKMFFYSVFHITENNHFHFVFNLVFFFPTEEDGSFFPLFTIVMTSNSICDFKDYCTNTAASFFK